MQTYSYPLKGTGINEKEIDNKTDKVIIEVDPLHFRPAEAGWFQEKSTKARNSLGWNLNKTSFDQLVHHMIQHNLEFVKKEL